MGLRATFIVGAAVTLGGVQAWAQDPSAGEALFQETCRNCHGPRAQGMASFPKLAHQDEDYLVMRLEQYRAGERVGPNTALMRPHATDLTDEQIASLAAYVAALD